MVRSICTLNNHLFRVLVKHHLAGVDRSGLVHPGFHTVGSPNQCSSCRYMSGPSLRIRLKIFALSYSLGVESKSAERNECFCSDAESIDFLPGHLLAQSLLPLEHHILDTALLRVVNLHLVDFLRTDPQMAVQDDV